MSKLEKGERAYRKHIKTSKRPAFRFRPWTNLPDHVKARFVAEEEPVVPLVKRSVKDLRELAASLGLDGVSRFNKAALVERIESAQQEVES